MGTRLLPATKSQPKEMLPVGRRPVVQYVVEEMEERRRSTQILFVTGRKKTAIEDHFDADPELVRMLSAADGYALLEELDYTETDARFYYTRQSEPRGLADAVRHAQRVRRRRSLCGGPGRLDHQEPAWRPAFCSEMIDAHLASGAACTIAVEEVDPEDAYRYGIVKPAPGRERGRRFRDRGSGGKAAARRGAQQPGHRRALCL